MAEPLRLASASPQRREILERLGIAHVVAPTHVAEVVVGPPREVAVENARRKALAGCANAAPGTLVLGADTVVARDGIALGKPRDAAQAREHLERLSGATHVVISAYAVVVDGAVRVAGAPEARVTFRALDAATLRWYVATGEWEGRAGGYAIQAQGAVLVERLEGDPLTVVGLPAGDLLARMPELLPGSAA